ncbi:helix-turn-helix domain-containing protein [Flavobacterium sp. 3HN19-14]|uniref:helix-turn-helix domain-containing protein n=1 Tax=Flavobacterium sp. 3HN19-14 TaxID=3448133 RepID=UPI003EE14EF1
METNIKPKHIGRNISRIRELRGMKQDALAMAIGVSQQTISIIENSEKVEEEKLELIAKELGVSPEAIKNFSDEGVINYFNSFHDNVVTTGSIFATNCTFNPLDKLIESHEENKQLYERLLKAQEDKVEYLEKLLNNK